MKKAILLTFATALATTGCYELINSYILVLDIPITQVIVRGAVLACYFLLEILHASHFLPYPRTKGQVIVYKVIVYLITIAPCMYTGIQHDLDIRIYNNCFVPVLFFVMAEALMKHVRETWKELG